MLKVLAIKVMELFGFPWFSHGEMHGTSTVQDTRA